MPSLNSKPSPAVVGALHAQPCIPFAYGLTWRGAPGSRTGHEPTARLIATGGPIFQNLVHEFEPAKVGRQLHASAVLNA